jgi:hypothetical protein
VIHRLVCPGCGQQEERFAAAGSVRYEEGRCGRDGQMRIVEAIHGYTGSESYGSRRLNQLGLPLFDIFVARSPERERGYLLDGDRGAVLGILSGEGAR